MRRTAQWLLLSTGILLLSTGILLASCQSEAPPHEEPNHGGSHLEEPGDEDGHAAHGDGASGEALPLRPIMQQLGSNMAGFTQALWLEEYALMEEFAEGIATHPNISDEEMERIRAELGQEMDAFVAADEAVHEASVRLHAAAESRDVDRILERLHEVQVGCMACHTQFRERLRSDQGGP